MLVTEHEHFVAPEVMKVLTEKIVEAEGAVAPFQAKANRIRNEHGPHGLHPQEL